MQQVRGWRVVCKGWGLGFGGLRELGFVGASEGVEVLMSNVYR